MICEVYQVNDNPEHLLLVVPGDGEIINGAWNIKNAEHYNLKVELVGHIEWPWQSPYNHEHYNETLYRFQNGERADPTIEKCPCCGKIK